MTRSLRRQHSEEVKAWAVLEAHPVQMSQWKKLAKEGLQDLFSRRKDLSIKAEAELSIRRRRRGRSDGDRSAGPHPRQGEEAPWTDCPFGLRK